ncbi:hypothetical protein ACOQFV_32020 [Nocardiopsis changdeensis]|uniref:Uncharacterized protein n=1 Tax=Nocardiopsis changdeensis TaxID=2831969 RepID=A0ABX8BSV2_9ACTN|nr:MULTISPECIES: hypothetical protein [Nocardiopsis]QUX24888.1 hypothetical protein KGD84_11835 [Nocardiopsis changdeensis]QYX35274.1 hypothetical protein K1J57_21280 [Nocardiopsis sp. MT53]
MVVTRSCALALAVLLAGCGGPGAAAPAGGEAPQATGAPSAPGPAPVLSPAPGPAPAAPSPADPSPSGGPAQATAEPSGSGGSGEPGGPGGRPEGEPPKEAVTGYLEALAATDDPDRMSEGLNLAADDSAAHDLLLHAASVARARADGGRTPEAAGLTPTADGARLCPAEGNDPDCGEYTDFTGRDGLVTGLHINGSDPGPSLIVGDGATADSEGVGATLVTAYRSVVDHTLVVTVEFAAVDAVSLDLDGAVYRAADGTGQRAEDAAGRRELTAGTATHAVFHFPDALPGGELSVGGCLAECSALVDLSLPVG